jgi:F0F1-type ATP synthase assembly protein I
MKGEWRPWTLVTQLGLTVVVTLLVTLFLGIWLDGLLGTRPWLTLFLSLVGVIGATVNAYRMVVASIGDYAKDAGAPAEEDRPKKEHHEIGDWFEPDIADDSEESEEWDRVAHAEDANHDAKTDPPNSGHDSTRKERK